MKAFILLSGGIDSMACVNFYKALNYEVECIFCDYGQQHRFQKSKYNPYVLFYLSIYLHPSIFRRKHHMVLTSPTGMF